jgi:hypothetical protein
MVNRALGVSAPSRRIDQDLKALKAGVGRA